MSSSIIQSNVDKKITKNTTTRSNTFKTNTKFSRSRVSGLHKNKSMPLFLSNNKRTKQTQLSNNTLSQIANSNNNTSTLNNKQSIINNNNNNNNIKHKDIFNPTTSPFYPKNFNEYRHLLNPFIKLKDTDVKWSIELRAYPKLKYRTKEENDEKFKYISPPQFYNEDLTKFLSKHKPTLNRSKTQSNFHSFKHLLSSNISSHSITSQHINFITTLRDFKPYKDVFINNKEWKKYSTEPKRPKTSTVRQDIKNERLVMRPYSCIREKVQVGKDTIYRKKYIRNKTEGFDMFGAHNSYPLFVDKYNERNFGEIHSYLCEGNKTVSQCMFEIGLRGEYKKVHKVSNDNDNKRVKTARERHRDKSYNLNSNKKEL